MTDEVTFAQQMRHKPINIVDITGMLRRQIKKNDRPYQADMIRYNNSLVDNWEQQVLRFIANDKNEVRTMEVEMGLKIFIEGHELKNHFRNAHLLPKVDDEMVMTWIEKLKNGSIVELRNLGIHNLQHGLQIVVDAVRLRNAEMKWQKIYQ